MCAVCRRRASRKQDRFWAREVMREHNWSIVFGQPLEALRPAWEARPGGVAIAAGPGVELQKAPLVSAQEKAFTRHRTLRKESRRPRKGRSSGARGLSVWARWSRKHSRENAKKWAAVERLSSSWLGLVPCPSRFCRPQRYTASLSGRALSH